MVWYIREPRTWSSRWQNTNITYWLQKKTLIGTQRPQYRVGTTPCESLVTMSYNVMSIFEQKRSAVFWSCVIWRSRLVPELWVVCFLSSFRCTIERKCLTSLWLHTYIIFVYSFVSCFGWLGGSMNCTILHFTKRRHVMLRRKSRGDYCQYQDVPNGEGVRQSLGNKPPKTVLHQRGI